MPRKFKMVPSKTQQVVYAEDATLPTLSAAGFSARVNAYVVGRAGACADGETDLWYLSLVGAHGQEATLRALWANLVTNRPHRGYASDAPRLGDVGRVALGHTRKDSLPTVLGWRIHWNWHMERVPPGRDNHAMLESDMLTCHDPGLLRDLPAMTAEELDAQKRRPCFLLLVRREDAANPQVVSLRHLRFLASRIAPLAYYPPFAGYLWERAQGEGEVEPLRVWCYDPATADHEGEVPTEPSEEERPASTSPALSGLRLPGPVLSGAYLCRPRPLDLMSDLQRWVRRGNVTLPSAPLTVQELPLVGAHTSPADGAPRVVDRMNLASATVETTSATTASILAVEPETRSGGATRTSSSDAPLIGVVREIVAAAGRTTDFESADEFLLKVVNPPWMDLVIEAHRLPSQQRQVTVTHYREQNGDLIPDPDMELAWDGTPRSLTVQGPAGPAYTHVLDEANTDQARTTTELAAFAALWAANLRAQGFVQAAASPQVKPSGDDDRRGETPDDLT